MKKFLIPLAALALTICACQRNSSSLKTELYEDDYVLPLSELRSDSLKVKMSVEYPVGGASDEVLKNLRKSIADVVFGGLNNNDNVAECGENRRQEIVDEYLAEYGQSAADTTDQRIMSWEFDDQAYFLPDWKDYYIYVVSIYEYLGGAHGNPAYITFVFDKKTGKQVEEWDFFKEGYEAPVGKLICKHIASDIIPTFTADGIVPEELQKVADENIACPNGVYLPGTDGVTWTFQPYEIAPYAYGIISVTVPWNELKDWVK